nr:hypothetical protein JUJ52_20430 [Virgibacillus sp. AGTR]
MKFKFCISMMFLKLNLQIRVNTSQSNNMNGWRQIIIALPLLFPFFRSSAYNEEGSVETFINLTESTDI